MIGRMIYSCCNENRRAAVLASATLNGIDFLEVVSADQRTLAVHCLKGAPTGLTSDNVLIQGGESITNIAIQSVTVDPTDPTVLLVQTAIAGDFSPYRLRLVASAAAALEDPFEVTAVLAGFDLQLAEVEFSFKVDCPPFFDCAPQPAACPPSLPTPPPINYLAKDYGSFRTLMLDRLNQLLPGGAGTSEADLGVALAELIAYVGDRLSYQQDAVSTEAYIETARSRISLRRHALLVDYPVHDGANARAWIQLQISGNTGDRIFLNRALTRFYTFAPGMPSNLAVGSGNEEAALSNGVQVFQPMFDAVLFPEHNQMSFYTWGDTDCCLPQGAMEATLDGALPNLQPGDVLIFQEMKGPQTGDPADADIRHRCAVRLTQVATLKDTLFSNRPVTEIQWSQDDALPFPVCISSTYLDAEGDTQNVTDVSVAFGNVVLADHGLSLTGKNLGAVPAPRLFYPPNPAADRCQPAAPTPLPVRFRPQVPDSPLTQAGPLAPVSLPAAGIPVTPSAVLFGASGAISLNDSNGFACVQLNATNAAGWPQLFGVLVKPNGSNFDIAVVYNPPGGAEGIQKQVVVEQFTNVPFNQMETQINSHSKLIQVLSTGAAPSGLPSTPTMLPNTGSVDLQDLGGHTYLSIQAANPSNWTTLIGVMAALGTSASLFNLQVVYDPPSGGVGVTLPVTLEQFTNLSLATAAGQVNGNSELVTVASFAQAAALNLSASALINFDPSQAVPVIALTGTLNAQTSAWTPAQDLLESGELDQVFVVEIESDGTATLRFGDNVNGKTPDQGTSFNANYRIGNGTAGNVGADSLVFLAAVDPHIKSCRNPLPAIGGTDPETNDQIRRRAPQAFLTQERAVTMADYEAIAESNSSVDQAVASLRWTGSWYTVFIAVEPTTGGNLTPALQQTLRTTEERYRLAGQDLELDSPQYVSLLISLNVCVDPDYFQSDVQQALLQTLSGVFLPGSFTFGQTVYLSPVYAAARSVAGVIGVTATAFQPQSADPVTAAQSLSLGEIKMGRLQVARLENNPSFPDHGQWVLTMEGGK
ncbi:MAG TPA: putative baseplate assembly protein [Bryobacteraceae bacterium]